MAKLNEEYKKFLDDIDQNVKNKEDLNYVKEKLSNFLDSVMQEMQRIVDFKSDKIKKLEETQNELDKKIEKMQQILDNIEKDIYSDEGFDFEIVCPYCNYEFVIDMDEERTEITCPECENIIELDWSGNLDDDQNDFGCNGSCHGCSGCGDTQEPKQSKQEDDDM